MTTNSMGRTNEAADISYDFPALPVGQLLDIYADLVGRTVLAASAGPSAVNLKDTTITLKTQSPLTKNQAIQALEMILGMNGITPVPVGDKFVKIEQEAQAGKGGGPISTNLNDLAKAGKMITQVIQIKYVALQDLVDILQPFSRMDKAIIALPSTQTLILRDYAENVDRMIEMVHRVDVLTPNAIKPQIIKIRYALASDISQALSQLGASGGGSVGKKAVPGRILEAAPVHAAEPAASAIPGAVASVAPAAVLAALRAESTAATRGRPPAAAL